jgi:hypothetical protein
MREQEGLSVNGLSVNGLSVNGLSVNGLSVNGLSVNGLSVNGLPPSGTSAAFSSWFNTADSANIAQHDMIMKYVIGCALPAGQTASFVDSKGATHTWAGALGLADTWGQSALTTSQKQWISACLMAHVNSALPAPKSIQLSVRGSASSLTGTQLEKRVITTFDGVFFGDLFASPNKRYLCRPSGTAIPNYLNTLLTDWGRQCFFSSDGCGGTFTMVDCLTACPQPTGLEYAYGPQCTIDGTSYNALNVYVPSFKRAVQWTLSGGTHFDTACVGCLDNRAITGFSSVASASASNWTAGVAGNVILDIRYANGNAASSSLKVMVNTTTVMNGSSASWNFPATGSWSVWGTRSVPVSMPSTATIKLIGVSGQTAPRVDVVSIRTQ